MKKQLLFLITLLLSYASIAQIPDSEKQALLALYVSLNNGIDWPVYEGNKWKEENPISSWYGITIQGGHVTEINSLANITGTLSSEIGDLTELRVLKIGGLLKITGSIPSEIGNLTKLITLDLSENEITGALPKEIGNLENLENLLLYRNQISGEIPAELSYCTKLTSIYLDENQLTGNIPNSLKSLALIQLFVDGNLLSGDVTNVFSSWPDLVFLGINGLTGDLDLSNNPNMRIFYAPNNQFSTINVKNGNNAILTNFTATNSSSLNCIQVDNQTNAINGEASYQNWNVDDLVTFSENCSSLSISDNTIQNNILINPNPAEDIIAIESKFNKIIEIKIYSYLGELLYSKKSQSGISKINVSNLKSGVYLIQFKDDSNHFNTTKLVKN